MLQISGNLCHELDLYTYISLEVPINSFYESLRPLTYTRLHKHALSIRLFYLYIYIL